MIPLLPPGWQRIALAAVLLLPLLVVVLALVPGLVLQPFLPGGLERTQRLLDCARPWVREVRR